MGGSDEDYFSVVLGVDTIDVGFFPQVIKEARNADEFELQLVKPFPSTYDSTIAEVRAERESKQWPALVNAKLDVAKYDTVFLGYPIMFGTFTPPIYTFLEANDLSGKVVVPFCTYGSGGRKASSEELKTRIYRSVASGFYHSDVCDCAR